MSFFFSMTTPSSPQSTDGPDWGKRVTRKRPKILFFETSPTDWFGADSSRQSIWVMTPLLSLASPTKCEASPKNFSATTRATITT